MYSKKDLAVIARNMGLCDFDALHHSEQKRLLHKWHKEQALVERHSKKNVQKRLFA